MHTCRRLLLLLPVLLVLSGAGQPGVRYVVQPGSRFYLDGTSTLGAYRCESDEVVGSGTAHPGDAARVTGTLVIPVLGFDCGRAAMNRDFYDALQAETHPTIRITLTDATLLSRPAGSTWVPVEVRARLQLAGAARAVTIRAEGRRAEGDVVEIRGSHALKMSQYGIRPPSGLMGLVRAHDSLVANFYLVVAAE